MTDAGRIKFVENKFPDMDRVTALFKECAAVNQWANFGPLYDRLADDYAAFMGLGRDLIISPCANGGIGLEVLARFLAAEQGVDRLRWVGCSFSFKNLGRGYFADQVLLDCDTTGMLDLAAVEALDPDSFDGIIVTNPFGMARDFDRYIQFAQRTGKRLLIDNAAGIDRDIPNWPWQSFSLHQTKPFGMGEGGLMLSPRFVAEELRYLINYDRVPADPAQWFNNGKISDIACAFQLARLHDVDTWAPAYRAQPTGLQVFLPPPG